MFAGAFLVLAALGISWAMTTAPVAVPDEQAHTIHAAAVVRGELVGDPSSEVRGWQDVSVPRYVAEIPQQLCSAFHAEISAACGPAITDDETPTRAVTSAGAYDPLTYFWTGLPTLFLDGAPAIYAMRIASVLLNAALLAGAVVALHRLPARGFSLLALAVGITPMVLFVGSGVNPNGTEIAAGTMAYAWLTVVARNAVAGTVSGWHVAAVAVPAVVLANTRSVGVLWILVYAVATLADRRVLERVRRSRAFWIGVVTIGVGVGASVAWTITSRSLAVTSPAPGVGTSFPRATVWMLKQTFDWFGSYVGQLGWLDTPLPPTTVLWWGSMILALLVTGIVFGRGRLRRAVVVMTAALVLLPAVIQGAGAHEYGYIWQGRYNLALLVPALVAAGTALDGAFPEAFRVVRLRGLVAVVLAVIAVMQVHAVLWVAHRYTVGFEKGWGAMLRHPDWQPPGTWELWAVVAGIAVLSGGWLLFRRIRRDGLDTARTLTG